MKKKLLALLLAAATVFSAVPSYVRAEEPETYDIVAHYDMSHSDTKLLDQSGKGNDAVLHNISSSDFKEELGDTFLELPGGNAGLTDLILIFLCQLRTVLQITKRALVWRLP